MIKFYIIGVLKTIAVQLLLELTLKLLYLHLIIYIWTQDKDLLQENHLDIIQLGDKFIKIGYCIQEELIKIEF